MKILNNKKGVTLPELMYVVIILGILSAIAIPVFGTLIENQNALLCQSCQKNIYQMYLNSSDSYDTSPFTSGVSSYNSQTDSFEEKFKSEFVEEINDNGGMPECPKKNHYYVIKWDGDLQISCYDEDGSLEDLHNNADLY